MGSSVLYGETPQCDVSITGSTDPRARFTSIIVIEWEKLKVSFLKITIKRKTSPFHFTGDMVSLRKLKKAETKSLIPSCTGIRCV